MKLVSESELESTTSPIALSFSQLPLLCHGLCPRATPQNPKKQGRVELRWGTAGFSVAVTKTPGNLKEQENNTLGAKQAISLPVSKLALAALTFDSALLSP